MPQQSRASQRVASAAVLVCSAACLAGTGYLLWISTQSFVQLQHVVLAAVPSGYADRFTPQLYGKLILASRLGSATLAILAAVALLLRRHIESLICTAAVDGQALFRFYKPVLSWARHSATEKLAFGFILLLGLFLRCYFLSEPIRKDESYSYLYYAQRPLVVGLCYYTANNHLLNTVLMHISTALFGGSVVALRLPTFLAGCLLPVLTYLAASLWCHRNAALFAMTLTCVSSPMIEYSFNARGYSLGALFYLLMLMLVKPALKGLRMAWLAAAVCAALALYSVPTMFYGVASLYLYLGSRTLRGQRKQVGHWLISGLLTAALACLLYTPVLLTVGIDPIIHNRWVSPIPRSLWTAQFLRELQSLGRYWTAGIWWPLALALGVVFLWSFLGRRTRILPPVAVVACLAVALCLMLPLQSIVPPRRSYLYALPLCCIAAGFSFGSIFSRWRSPRNVPTALSVCVALVLGGSMLLGKPFEHPAIESIGCPDAAEIVQRFRTQITAGAQFLCEEGADSPLDFYMQRERIPYHPRPLGPLLIVVKRNTPPQSFVASVGLTDKVADYRLLGTFSQTAVYQATRGKDLPFLPGGTADMGAFTSY